jgi:hypothetical protein
MRILKSAVIALTLLVLVDQLLNEGRYSEVAIALVRHFGTALGTAIGIHV